jgi:hypothetical protein
LWGGSPVKYIRDLTEEEKLNNYNESYSQAVNVGDKDERALWPKTFLDQLPEGEEGAENKEQYIESNYFRKGLFK